MKNFIDRIRNVLSPRPAQPAGVKLQPQLDAYLTTQVIGQALAAKKPFLASRLGWVEASCIGKSLEDESVPPALNKLNINAGVFPPTLEQFLAFRSEYLAGINAVDLLGVMQCPFEAELIAQYGGKPLLTWLSHLEPYFASEPWSQYLEGLRVIVVHPFADSIQSQYESARERIFLNPKVLPSFKLRMIRAPQTIAGNEGGFASWSAALEHLKEQVLLEDFDAAIVGCGAYGLPLGAFIKAQGKACVHMGGATQILFGVTGARWRDQPHFRALQTDAWKPPLEAERPPNWKSVEDGCYW